MKSSTGPVLRDLVLVGGGHSHVVVLRMFAMRPEPGVRLTLVCTDVDTPYSGMLPGYVAGHYEFDEVHIDLLRLCAFAGARFVHAEVTGIDRENREILLRGRPALPYDLVSINIGSTPQMASIPGAREYCIPVKPIAQFNRSWLTLLDEAKNPSKSSKPLTHIAVVGGGAGGVELALSVQHRLRQELTRNGDDPDRIRFTLLTSGDTLLPTHNPRVQRHMMHLLESRGIQVVTGSKIVQVQAGSLMASDGRHFASDRTLWVTQAGGAPWLAPTGLALDAHGFIRINHYLQSVSDPEIFAAGDIASFEDRPLEKAGVFAVRMGRPLALNLRLALRGQPLRAYDPQRHWLALIGTGDQHAVASRAGFNTSGRWVWRWKDWIDRRFMQRFNALPRMQQVARHQSLWARLYEAITSGLPAAAQTASAPSRLRLSGEESLQALSAIAMRCGGCGAKVGATVLSRALAELSPVQRDDVLVGLHAPDDAAVLNIAPHQALVHSVDFFRAFIDDPYLFGRIAANHALGDLFAMGATPQSATAIVTVPPGLERKTEDLLRQMMQGALEVLNESGCALVGGHTGEGQELALGFAVNGLIDRTLAGLTRKAGMQPGDLLILTKPIGTGTLFAAHAQHAARGRWIIAALETMQQSNRLAAEILRAHGVHACTDLTGFGLLGHLVEMTRPSGVDATISLSALPLLAGATDCIRAGITSSLQPSNLRLRRAIRNPDHFREDPRYALLFDPQTAGGLLASMPSGQAEACLADLRAAGYQHSACIGRISAQQSALEPVLLEA